MSGKSHQALAVASALFVSEVIVNDNLSADKLIVLVVVASLGGLIADIDHGGSKLGSKIPILHKILKHRGFTHTIWFVFLMYLITSLFLAKEYVIYFIVGMISHLIADMLTPAGIKPLKIGFNLFDYNVSIPIVQNKIIEVGVTSTICFVLMYFVYQNGTLWR